MRLTSLQSVKIFVNNFSESVDFPCANRYNDYCLSEALRGGIRLL